MLITGLRASPQGRARVRLEAVAVYRDDVREQLWIEVPDGPHLPRPPIANHWAAALVPWAATLGEALTIDGAVDPWLLDGLMEVQRAWSTWGLIRAPVPVIATELLAPAPPSDRVGLFFSGGVDSFYSLLRNRAEHPVGDRGRVDDLLLVLGADIDIASTDVHAAVQESLGKVAARFEARLLPVATNLRQTGWSRTDWPKFSHGAFFAGMAHAVGGLGKVLIASSGTYADIKAWGSTPLTDPMFSSSSLRIVNDSSDIDRYGKLSHVAQHDEALTQLRVCWRSGTAQNCGRCLKCLRTMVSLELLGALGRSASFPSRQLDLGVICRLYPKTPFEYKALRGLAAQAEAQNRYPLMRALDRAVRSTERIQLALDLVTRAEVLGLPAGIAGRLRRALVRGRIMN